MLQVRMLFHTYCSVTAQTVLSLFTSRTPILYTVKESPQTTTRLCLFFSHLAFRENEYFNQYSHCCHWYYVYEMYSPRAFGYLHCTIVVVLLVCCDSWRSCRGFSKQKLLFRSGLPLPSPAIISHLCVPYSESFLLPIMGHFFLSCFF